MKNLVLLGGGYGNMRIMSRILPDALPENYTLTLIDRMPFHGLKPEFYALAAGTKSDSDVRMNFLIQNALIQFMEKLMILI